MAIGFCGIRNSFLLSFFSTNLVSKESSEDSNVPKDTNNDDETIKDDDAELSCTGQSKKSCTDKLYFKITRGTTEETGNNFWHYPLAWSCL